MIRALRITLLCGLGFAAGWSAWQSLEAGYPQGWGKLPRLPAAATELVAPGDPPFMVQTEAGSLYEFSSDGGWLPAEPLRQLSGPPAKVQPCAAAFLRFTLPDVRPSRIRQCAHIKTYYTDGWIEYGVALDSGGDVWKWQQARTAGDLPGYVFGMVCGPSLGVFVGLVLSRAWEARQRPGITKRTTSP